MTTARTTDLFIEVLVSTATRARTTDLAIEVLTKPVIRARTTDLFIEVLVGKDLGEGWTVGYLPIG